MPSLKDLKDRIGSVKNTQKITKAMKMVAAAKLRKAQDRAMKTRKYSDRLDSIMSRLASNNQSITGRNLLSGSTTGEKTKLLVCATADRGLCGGFNSSIIKTTILEINNLEAQGINVKVLCVGSKGNDVLSRNYSDRIVKIFAGLTRNNIEYSSACLLYTSPSPRDLSTSRMPSSA